MCLNSSIQIQRPHEHLLKWSNDLFFFYLFQFSMDFNALEADIGLIVNLEKVYNKIFL